jgi:hypothetical protein
MFESSTGKLLVAAGLLLAFASPASALTNTGPVAVAPLDSAATDTGALLVAQLDSVAAFCSQRFPANKNLYVAFVDNVLSGAAPRDLARTRDSQNYERAREFDMSQLEASRNDAAGICSGLTAPVTI